MNEIILDEFKMPVNGTTNIFLRVVQGERINILQIIMDDKIIPIHLIGYAANAIFEVGNKFAIKYASLTELMPNYPQFTPQAQPMRLQQTTPTTFTPQSNSYSSKSTSPKQFAKTITVDEAIAILKHKAPVPTERIKVKTTEADMIDFILKFKGGSELYIGSKTKGDLYDIRKANLYIDYPTFNATIEKLLAEHIISKKQKISSSNHAYWVYVIPKELPTAKPVVSPDITAVPIAITEEPKIQIQPSPQVEPATTINVSKITAQQKDLIAQSHDNQLSTSRQPPTPEQGPRALIPALQLKSTITDYLETVFYSYQDSDLDMQLFLSETQHQKIPDEVARDFYIRKLEERDKRLLRLSRQSSATTGD